MLTDEQKELLTEACQEVAADWKKTRHGDLFEESWNVEFGKTALMQTAKNAHANNPFFWNANDPLSVLFIFDWLEVYRLDFADENPNRESWLPVQRPEGK